ncbi:MAG: hypothetical protein M9910_11040 [Kiritimatiellae bacterium]|nr:hypothetical protein [Kiritimatiellia bacterium]
MSEQSETEFSNDWKNPGRIFQTLEDFRGIFPSIGKTRQRASREKLRRSAGAKRRTKQAVRSSRPHGLRSSLGWLLPPEAA